MDRLKEDHLNAKLLADKLAFTKGIELDHHGVKTNIIFFKMKHPQIDGDQFLNQLEEKSIKILMTDPGVFRAVVHREVSKDQVETVAQTINSILTTEGVTK